MTESGVGVSRGPAAPPKPPAPPQHHTHLWNEHLAALKRAQIAGSREGTRPAFSDPRRGTDYLPVGQWLVAMDRCQDGHAWQMFGDPCYCGSDNCDYCARCGVEHHD